MTKEITKKCATAVALLLVAILSVLVVSKCLSSPATYAGSISYLDEKRTTVMELTAASAAASTAITVIPGETAMPIAEKLADLSSYFLVVICAIFAEKYLLTITGYVAFKFVIPIACLLLIIYVFRKYEWMRSVATKLIAFGVVISFVIPGGVWVSRTIEAAYKTSIEATIDAAEEVSKELKDSSECKTEEQGILSGVISSIGDAAKGVIANFENVLGNFIEALAVLIVTSCVIPVLVLLFLLWITKIITGINIQLPHQFPHRKKISPEMPCAMDDMLQGSEK